MGRNDSRIGAIDAQEHLPLRHASPHRRNGAVIKVPVALHLPVSLKFFLFQNSKQEED